MTPDEMNAAVERVRKYRQLRRAGLDAMKATVEVYGPVVGREFSPSADDAAVLDAYLAEHDPTPVDPEWLQSLGEPACGQYLWHVKVFSIPKGRRTRGHARTLLRALGEDVRG